jgi:hypothetical protein
MFLHKSVIRFTFKLMNQTHTALGGYVRRT